LGFFFFLFYCHGPLDFPLFFSIILSRPPPSRLSSAWNSDCEQAASASPLTGGPRISVLLYLGFFSLPAPLTNNPSRNAAFSFLPDHLVETVEVFGSPATPLNPYLESLGRSDPDQSAGFSGTFSAVPLSPLCASPKL